MAYPNRAVDAKNNNQYKAVDFFVFCSMDVKNFVRR